MKYDLNHKDVFVWFCRNDRFLAFVEAYRRGDAEEQGRLLYEQIEKALHAVDEYSCTHLLLVCEGKGRYADFVRKEYKKISSSRTMRAICDMVSERELDAMLDTLVANVVYVLPDDGNMPECLLRRPKYMFADGSMFSWPEGCPSPDFARKQPAAWTRYFMLGGQALAYQLENIRTILKARGNRGVPQYVLITGETGTGKSFVARSLAKICGDKYDDREVCFTEDSKVEAGERGDTGKSRKVQHVKCNIIFGTNRDLDADAQEWESSHGRAGCFVSQFLISCVIIVPLVAAEASIRTCDLCFTLHSTTHLNARFVQFLSPICH